MPKTDTAPDPNLVQASPTKEFFIYMLTKDIELSRAILDLVDNSVDGARRVRPNENHAGLSVRLEVTKNHFRISDNCGGIDVDLARDYAFKFGRDPKMPKMKHSVGQFGVGMKRALFKIGRHFRIESSTASSRFVISQGVEQWKDDPEWNLTFSELDENTKIPPDDRGTVVEVTQLLPSVSADFQLENFRHRLGKEIQDAHQESIEKGLAITLNKIPLVQNPITLLESDEIRSAFQRLKFRANGGPRVRCKLYAGISESAPDEAGWYVFCNGRLVLGADQTTVTGWGEGRGRIIPHYHNQFARFRGYGFFDCDDAALLPWNTTKTGIDTDSKVFRGVRQHILKVTRPVIDFLNALDAEKDREDGRNPLDRAVNQSKPTGLAKIKKAANFKGPKARAQPPGPPTGRIQYSKPLKEIDEVKRVLKVRALKEVGEGTFDYFRKHECSR